MHEFITVGKDNLKPTFLMNYFTNENTIVESRKMLNYINFE